MPRLRNDTSGVVVNVDDDTAARMLGKWSEVKGTEKQSGSTTKRTTARKSASSKSDDSK